ncbi:hypothetical protein [Nesterenkonia sp. F]|uniref:hypothetical protein n=1 Tax=Nesterenkonia sp. F TaxID=795955 RepID=UPI000255CFBD|nr:hypothetical protein [Nesterenkonia sp. F]
MTVPSAQPPHTAPAGIAGRRPDGGVASPGRRGPASAPGEDVAALRGRHGDPTPRRLLRRLRRLLGDDDFPDSYEQALGGCQLPVATGRRVGVLSVDGGVGRSTLTAAVGLVLAAARADAVSVVDLGPTPSGVAARLPEQVPASSWRQLVADPASPDRAATGLHRSLRRTGSSLHLLDRDPDPTAHPAPAAEEVELIHHVLARAFSVSVLELPPAAMPMPAASLEQMHCLILVSGAAASSAARAAEHLHRLRDRAPQVPILPVVSSTRPATPAERRGAYDVLGAASGTTPLLVDHDRHLAPGLPISLERVGEQRRLQLVELAATALSLAASPGPHSAHRPGPHTGPHAGPHRADQEVR